MGYFRFVLYFAVAGLVVALAIFAWHAAGLDSWVNTKTQYNLFRLQLIIYPSSIIFMGFHGAEKSIIYKVLVFSSFINIAYYSIIGSLTWLGIYKNKFFLLILAIALGTFWWKLLNM